ncbi:conserved hypothetical protein [Vibrio chagasii]|nr:conserved hypothetical protein [Vibrio chagasii]CAH7253952.1 conserved hypothetical protein [Vibrio chagasii]CAH7432810.1 conserved hypothetical protein [Vibrio chagasii]
MDTKNTILAIVLQAQSECDSSLQELFLLIKQAVIRSEVADIDWYIMNDMSDDDVLLFIILNDIELSINYNESVLIEVVQYIFSRAVPRYH